MLATIMQGLHCHNLTLVGAKEVYTIKHKYPYSFTDMEEPSGDSNRGFILTYKHKFKNASRRYATMSNIYYSDFPLSSNNVMS